MQRSRELLLLKRSEVETRNRLVFIHNIEKQISLTQILGAGTWTCVANLKGFWDYSNFIKTWFHKVRKADGLLQVNLCKKIFFLNQLTHNMTTDCSLNYKFNAWKLQAQNMFFCLFLIWHSEQFMYTLWACNFHVLN